MPMSPRLLRPRAAGGFDPRTISGLALWLDAADSTTITLNGSNVSEWRDKSGNSRNATQTTASNQPPYSLSGLGGKPSLSFSTLTQFMNVSLSLPSGSDFSLFAAVRLDTIGGAANYQRLISGLSDSQLVFGTVNGNAAFFTGSGTTWNDVSANSPARSVFQTARVLSAVRSGSSGFPFVNGEAQNTKTTTLTGNIAAITVGWNTASQTWLGPVGEILIVTRAVSSAERQQIERYLGAKWGISVA